MAVGCAVRTKVLDAHGELMYAYAVVSVRMAHPTLSYVARINVNPPSRGRRGSSAAGL